MTIVNANPYQDIITAIEGAGFYVSGPNHYEEPECSWDRIIPASKLRPQGGYTGNSFWVSFDDDGWFIGVWSGNIYGIPDPSKIATMAIDWMSAEPNGTHHDFDLWITQKYDLYKIDDNDFRPTRLMADRKD